MANCARAGELPPTLLKPLLTQVAACLDKGTFEPQHPLVVDSFKNCEGLSRIAFLDGNTAVMLGKVVKTTTK